MTNKISFAKWLQWKKYFANMTHFNKYINSLSSNIDVQKEIVDYYKEQYEQFCSEVEF